MTDTTEIRRLRPAEFIALMAMLAATVAFSIDAMLPALPEIADTLSPDAPNLAQLVVTAFVLGLGAGTLVTGPLSDAYGRKPVILGFAGLYCLGALLAWQAQSLELLLAARLLQGIGGAGPRVVALAIVRDLHGGREMARILSFVQMVFTLVPALAPSLGAALIALGGWRSIFPAFVVFSGLSMAWLALRQPETLPPRARRPISARALAAATREVLSLPTPRQSVIVQTLCFGMLFSVLSSAQQVFDRTFGLGDSFPLWFGGIAVAAASSALVNARLVVRLGMRAMVKGILTAQIGLSATMVATWLAAPEALVFPVFLLWITSVFFQAGLTIGNLTSLAMEPVPHIAGLAASLINAIATVGAVTLAVPIGLAFDGTPLPLAAGLLCLAIPARLVTGRIRRPGEEDA